MPSGGSKAFIWLFVVLVAVALLIALAFMPVGVDKREAMTKQIAELKTEASSRTQPRSVLRGTASPGNAWDEYNLALNDAAMWSDDENGGVFLRFAKGDNDVDRGKVERLAAEHALALDHVRLGAQRSGGPYPYDWDRGMQMALPSLLACRRLAYLAVAQAKLEADRGRSQDGVDVLLNTDVFARDLTANAPLLTYLIGLVVYSTTFDELHDLVLSGKLTQAQLADLAKKLETVDHDFPALSSSLSAETLVFGMALSKASEEGLSGWFGVARQGGWRFALNPGSSMLETLEEKEEYMHRAEKLDQMNFADARKEIDLISAKAHASSNPIIRMSEPSLLKSTIAHRETLAHLRLLRAGTTFLATGETPTLADPFGGNLFYKQEARKWKVWSIGSDGTNQNGMGNWGGRPDMVFEIPK